MKLSILVFIAVIACALVGQAVDAQQCSCEEFTCATGGQCVPFGAKCNGTQDCNDGSDESSATCDAPESPVGGVVLTLIPQWLEDEASMSECRRSTGTNRCEKLGTNFICSNVAGVGSCLPEALCLSGPNAERWIPNYANGKPSTFRRACAIDQCEAVAPIVFVPLDPNAQPPLAPIPGFNDNPDVIEPTPTPTVGSGGIPQVTYTWKIVAGWSPCSLSCSWGQQTREIICVDNNGETNEDITCNELAGVPKPDVIQSCTIQECPVPTPVVVAAPTPTPAATTTTPTPVDTTDPAAVVCTADAFQCADGNWVGRTGALCTFVCPTEENPQTPVCSMDRFTCPDGSLVGRDGVNCAFAPCPQEPVVCATDVQQCADGTWVSRFGAECTFPACADDTTTPPVDPAPVDPAPVLNAAGCPVELRFCPDESSVMRTGDDCVFALCSDNSVAVAIDIGSATSVAPTTVVTVLFAIVLSLLQL